MFRSLVLAKNIGRALMAFVGGPVGMLGTFLLDMADDAMEGATHEANERELREEIAQLRASIASSELQSEYRDEVNAAVDDFARDKTPSEREQIKTYLYQLPYSIERTLATPTDPLGERTLQGMSLRSGCDLLPLLPTAIPSPELQEGKSPPGLAFIRLERFLGNGGMGDVWLATDLSLPPDRQQVVLKFCRDPKQAGLLLQHEATLNFLLQGNQHLPGVVRLEAAYFLGKQFEFPPCLKYEYVSGGTLTELVKDWSAEEKRPQPDFIAETVLQIARTVGHFHTLERPIVHRDLKPANILVHREGTGKFQLKIADFGIGGIAAAEQIRATQLTETTGQNLPSLLRGSHSALYASRQQRAGEPPDPRDDVYALGVIWFQLLLGDVSEELSPTWDEELEDAGVKLPAAHYQLLRRCLRGKREGRPDNAAVFANALEPLLQSSVSRSESPPGQSQTVTSTPSPSKPEEEFQPVSKPKKKGNLLSRFIRKSASTEETPQQQTPTQQAQAKSAAPLLKPVPAVASESKTLHRSASSPSEQSPARAETSQAVWKGEFLAGQTWRGNSLGMTFCWCPAGFFRMGSPQEETFRLIDENPVTVQISYGFLIGKYPVTQQEWRKMMKSSIREQRKKHDTSQIYVGEGDRFPMYSVNWNEANQFCKRLSQECHARGEIPPDWEFRLPTEAEWEYACRAQNSTRTPYGDTLEKNSINCEGQLRKVAPVGYSRPNFWGLCDMLGNVWEWCLDRYTPQLPGGVDPLPHDIGSQGVTRGGSFQSDLRFCRSAQRMSKHHSSRQLDLGFRIVLAPQRKVESQSLHRQQEPAAKTDLSDILDRVRPQASKSASTDSIPTEQEFEIQLEEDDDEIVLDVPEQMKPRSNSSSSSRRLTTREILERSRQQDTKPQSIPSQEQNPSRSSQRLTTDQILALARKQGPPDS